MNQSVFTSGWHVLRDWIFPTRCEACHEYLRGGDGIGICRDCWKKIILLTGPCCPRCGKPFASEAALSHSPGHICGDCRKRRPSFDHAVAAGRYEGVLAEAIHSFKYRGRTGLAKPLGLLAVEAMNRLPPVDCLVPVPLHPSRLREREFNQALLLCDRVGGLLDLPVIPDILERVRRTPPQIGLSIKDRRRNMRRAFVPRHPNRIKDRTVALVDDVLTTGATVNECARILKRSGARSVCVLTVARTSVWPA